MKNVTPLRAPELPADKHPTTALSHSDPHPERSGMTDFDGLPVLIPVPRASAYRYVEAGELPVKRLGGRIFIVRDRLRDLLEAA
jgi:hypothetical protein